MRKPPFHDRLAVLLREAREQSGLSQRQLAKRLGTNQTQVSMIGSGTQYVRVVDLFDWCAALGLDEIEVIRSQKDG